MCVGTYTDVYHDVIVTEVTCERHACCIDVVVGCYNPHRSDSNLHTNLMLATRHGDRIIKPSPIRTVIISDRCRTVLDRPGKTRYTVLVAAGCAGCYLIVPIFGHRHAPNLSLQCVGENKIIKPAVAGCYPHLGPPVAILWAPTIHTGA